MWWQGEMHPRKWWDPNLERPLNCQLFTRKSIFGHLNMPQPSCSTIVSTLLPQLVLRKPLRASCVCRRTGMLYAHSSPRTRWAPEVAEKSRATCQDIFSKYTIAEWFHTRQAHCIEGQVFWDRTSSPEAPFPLLSPCSPSLLSLCSPTFKVV